jgi:hypothetical protein
VIPEPEAILSGTVRYAAEDRADPVVLTLAREWPNQRLAAAEAQRDPLTTQLTPKLASAPDHRTWLLYGYGLNAHEELGTVRIAYGLLLERAPNGQIGGYWYEDRMVVPTSLWRVRGHIDGAQVELELIEVTDADLPGVPARVIGLLRPGL